MASIDMTDTEAMKSFALLQILEPIHLTKVNEEKDYNYYGAIASKNFIHEGSKFVANNSDGDPDELRELLTKFVQVSQSDYLLSKGHNIPPTVAAWLAIRMTSPTDEYVTPRWHRDGCMYDSDRAGEVNSKYAATLLGNVTLVLAESDLVRETMTSDQNEDENRKVNAHRLSSEVGLDIKLGQIFSFSWGQKNSPVHSEPDMRSDRVFVSILFGSENEIQNMCEFRDQIYRE